MEAVGHTCRNSPFWEVNNLDSKLTHRPLRAYKRAYCTPPNVTSPFASRASP